MKQSGEIHLVLDCDTDKVAGLLGEAMAAGMMTAYHNYLITRCCTGQSGSGQLRCNY